MMKLKDIMSKNIITCKYSDTLNYVSELMLKYDIGFLPVTKDNKIIGVITDRDIIIKGYSKDIKTSINNIKSYPLISINQESTLKEALDLMKENKVKRLLVTDNNLVTGVVSISDFLKFDDLKDDIINTLKWINTISLNEYKSNLKVNDFYL